MDLVDIDQVLDNLELREAADENSKATAQRPQQPLPQLSNSPASTEGTVGNGNAPSPSQSVWRGQGGSKGFVGVSQVFNSLDDYRKNVELLEATPLQKYDEECRRPIRTQADSEEALVKKDDDQISAVLLSAGSQSPDGVQTAPVAGQRLLRDESDDDDDDDAATNDIHKFTENSNSRLAESNELYAEADNSNTSDSLTTSSSSTFSSGPSPGLASTTDERHSPLSPALHHAGDEEERSALLDAQQEDQVEDDEEQSRSEDAHVNAADSSLTSKQDNTPAAAEGGAALDNLAFGVSSISLTTANSQVSMPVDGSVSSALGNILEELSETTTTSLVSQLREEADAQPKQVETRSFATISQSFPDFETKDRSNSEVIDCLQPCGEDAKAPQINGIVLAHQPYVAVIKQQPITFGSTMDEISDTELDSMLQEMDIDDVAADNSFVKRLATAEAAEPDSGVLSTAKSTVSHAPIVTVDDLGSQAADCVNADSFSQASTVEFSELRAQTTSAALAEAGDVEVDVEIEEEELGHSSNSVESSFTSSESSLEDDELGVGAEGDDCSHMRPQRPTTLDLPALKNNLYANAGQTPPGSVAQQDVNGAAANQQCSTRGEDENHADAAANEIAEATGYSDPNANLGRVPPIWVPDNMAAGCMQCDTRFTMIKRRHHCRACGKVLCSVCCSQKFKLEFLSNPPESRVCVQCYLVLIQRQQSCAVGEGQLGAAVGPTQGPDVAPVMRSPNPNNPMEYCSTIPPHRQVSASAASAQPPSVIVPVGVLKKDGSYSSNSSNSSSKHGRKRKSVMFSDGIAPGSDLASLEHQWGEAKQARRGQQQQQQPHSSDKSRNAGGQKGSTPAATEPSGGDGSAMDMVVQLFRSKRIEGDAPAKSDAAVTRPKRLPPSGCDEHGCFIPQGADSLPPLYVSKDDSSCDFDYKEVTNNYDLMERLQRETLKFAVQRNFFVYVKIVHLKCCMNRTVINFTTSGMHHVGNDEIVILLEYDPPSSRETASASEAPIPRDIFVHLDEIYREAEHGSPIAELSYTSPRQSNFLGSREYGGFIYIRATFQCLQDIVAPENPFLIGILIHRCEVPWAKVFPLRLMLRLGAQYRYYPCPHISMRNRSSVYAEIAQTIINFLADFRNYSYTLPSIRGMYIHMEERQTTVLIPRNRQDDVIKAINNASDHILAFGGNFSKTADGHLVCMQNVNDDQTEMYAYSTQAINIQGQPRKVTGASFFVLNESLKSTSGLSGKCSIVEDGLMVQILPAKMESVRNALRNQNDIDIVCGPLDADEQQTEIVSIKWVDSDRDFNVGVKSPVDDKDMEGVSSMRVHASFNYSNANYAIRLTDIYILKFDAWYSAVPATLAVTSADIMRIAEQIARSASMALVPFLDLLAANGNLKIGLRATLHQDSVGYEAGTRGAKLPPLYMNALDNHLIPTLHNESSGIEDEFVLELIFYILNV